ncbi:HdaA/DnaA family protein [Denitrobaculum tricleocarpae]|uniref:DNA replication protein n=1 Tax=Denitrobaculum tricleocarpae TaxID=2591009 RepID=A0A545TU21_9PROT|nr:DnaA/Hda family protein [Denitrobaculum tricleocarpae]TQV80661.1 DNA replication protein [Denitrobaculum tricleocarpae]
MSRPAQIPLDLGHRPALGREDFLVMPSNELAVGVIDNWPQWQAFAIALCGPPGSGKSHLCQVWRASSGAVEVDAQSLAQHEPPELIGDATCCVVDGVEEALATSAELQRRLFHLYNMMRERDGYLLVSGREAPARWRCGLADLRSRLSTLPVFELGAPDDLLIEAVLVKMFADRQLKVSPEVLRYILPRMERSFACARALVTAIDASSLEQRRDITIPLVRDVLESDRLSPRP